MIAILCRSGQTFGIMTEEGDTAILSPETVGSELMRFIEKSKGYRSDGKPGRSVIFVQDLDLIGAAIIKDLVKRGYHDSTHLLEFTKKRVPYSYQYVVSADMGTWYSMTIFRRDGFDVCLYSLENVTGQITPETMSKYGRPGEDRLHTIMRTSWGIISELSEMTDGKVSLTLSSWAMRMWSDGVCIYDRSDIYPDYHKMDNDLYGCTMDEYIRNGYTGGWCYVNAEPKEYTEGITLDVNSLYPYVMKTELFPVCRPTEWVGEIPEVWQSRIDRGRAVAIYHIGCKFEIKEGYLPFIMIPGDFMHRGVQSRSAVQNSKGNIDEPVELWLTLPEYKLFLEHYNVWDLKVYDGLVWQGCRSIFSRYVDKMYHGKKTARDTHNLIQERVYKMLLNSLSGSMAKKKKRHNLLLDEEGQERGYVETESNAKSMIPLGVFITSYARCYIVRVCQANIDRFLYSDTDSAHLTGSEPPAGIQIGTGLGQMKIERRWDRARFYGQKVYIEHGTDGWKLVYAGVPSEVQGQIEDELNGVEKMEKYFGKIPWDHIEETMQADHVYMCEVSTGTYRIDARQMRWRIGLSDKKKQEREAVQKRIRALNRDNVYHKTA